VAESISPAQLNSWNPILGINGVNCGSEQFANEYYRVGISGGVTATTTSSASAPTKTSVAAPGPTQTGVISTCNKFAESIPGKGCYDFAVTAGITPA
jgi:hypothetical protein